MYPYRPAAPKIVDLAPYLRQRRRARCRDALYTVLAVWTQYLSLGALALYGILRLLLFPQVPIGAYTGPLAVLWAVSFFLLLTSYISNLALWQKYDPYAVDVLSGMTGPPERMPRGGSK